MSQRRTGGGDRIHLSVPILTRRTRAATAALARPLLAGRPAPRAARRRRCAVSGCVHSTRTTDSPRPYPVGLCAGSSGSLVEPDGLATQSVRPRRSRSNSPVPPRRSALGVIMLDVDQFKAFNATPAQAGDRALAAVGAASPGSGGARTDLSVGGEEFAMLLRAAGTTRPARGERSGAPYGDQPPEGP